MKLTDFSSIVLKSEGLVFRFSNCTESSAKRTWCVEGGRTRNADRWWEEKLAKLGLDGFVRKKTCRSRRSIRPNKFFSYLDKNKKSHCNLSICKIMSLVYVWLMTRITLVQAIQLTGCAKATVCDRFNLFREACILIVNEDSKLVGTADRPVQIDILFYGKV